ncbi:MAG: AEC family transporter, partial [Lachnospiraceae bacterium]|nr:AEC family transporter [Lachnospiraceae bacterium]
AALYCGAATLLYTLFLMWIVPRWEKDPAKQGAMVHCGFRSNAMLFALPIAQGVFGRDVPEAVIVLAMIVTINNLESVPLMEYYRNRTLAGRSGGEASRLSLKKMLLNLLKTPLFVGVILGTLWGLLRIPMPSYCGQVVSGMAGTVVPLAFIVLGARLNFSHLKANRKNVLRIVFTKLVLSPAVFLILPIAAGWSHENIVAILVAFGAPSAVICYAMTELYDCDADTAGEIVSLSSAFSMLTIFLWIFALKQFGFIA